MSYDPQFRRGGPDAYVRGQHLGYSHWGPSPDELITCLRCGCDDMAKLQKDGTFVCHDCGMEHDWDGAMIGEADIEVKEQFCIHHIDKNYRTVPGEGWCREALQYRTGRWRSCHVIRRLGLCPGRETDLDKDDDEDEEDE